MDLHKMIAELQAEKQRLDEAIVALERLSAGKVRPKVRSQNSTSSVFGKEASSSRTSDSVDEDEDHFPTDGLNAE